MSNIEYKQNQDQLNEYKQEQKTIYILAFEKHLKQPQTFLDARKEILDIIIDPEKWCISIFKKETKEQTSYTVRTNTTTGKKTIENTYERYALINETLYGRKITKILQRYAVKNAIVLIDDQAEHKPTNILISDIGFREWCIETFGFSFGYYTTDKNEFEYRYILGTYMI
jgi:hypothetical protein